MESTRLSLLLIAMTCSVMADNFVITDLCQGSLHTLTLYGSTQHTFTIGTRADDLSVCTVFVKTPDQTTTTSIDVSFDSDYSVGYTSTNTPIANKGLRIQDNLGAFKLGTYTVPWAGRVDNGNTYGDVPQPFTVTRSTPGQVLTIKYKGVPADDNLTMKVTMTCTPGPCPTAPPTTTTTTVSTSTTSSSSVSTSTTSASSVSTSTTSASSTSGASTTMVTTKDSTTCKASVTGAGVITLLITAVTAYAALM